MKNTPDKQLETRKRKGLLIIIVTGIVVVSSFLYWLYLILRGVSG